MRPQECRQLFVCASWAAIISEDHKVTHCLVVPSIIWPPAAKTFKRIYCVIILVLELYSVLITDATEQSDYFWCFGKNCIYLFEILILYLYNMSPQSSLEWPVRFTPPPPPVHCAPPLHLSGETLFCCKLKLSRCTFHFQWLSRQWRLILKLQRLQCLRLE